MTNINETPDWESSIYQIKRGDKVEGGPAGPANVQASQLANRTRFLYNNLMELKAAVYAEILIAADIAEGMSKTVSGQYFRVWQGENGYYSFIYYFNDGGVARLVAAEANGKTVLMHAAASGLTVSQPNLFSNDVSDTKALPPVSGATVLPVITRLNGTPCFKMSTAPGSVTESGETLGIFSADNFPSGFISGSLSILDADASTGSASQLRLLVMQFDSAGNEIGGARNTVRIATTESVSGPLFVSIPGATRHASCASVALYLGITTGNSAAVRNVWFRDLLMADGVNPSFRRREREQSTTEQIVTGRGAETVLSPPQAAVALDQILSGLAQSNLFPEYDFSAYAVGDIPAGWANVQIATVQGKKVLRALATTTASASSSPPVDVSALAGSRVSVSVDILAKTGDQGVTGGLNNLRFRLAAFDSAGALINTAWQNAEGNDDNTGQSGTGWQYYSRDVPRSGITSLTRLSVARGVVIPANAAKLVLNVYRRGTVAAPCPEIIFDGIVMSPGYSAVFLAPYPSAGPTAPSWPATDNRHFMTEALTGELIKRKNFWDVNKNRYPDSRMQAETAGAYSTRWGSPLRVQKINGVMALQVPVAGLVNAAAGYNDTPIDITGFTSGFFSAAVDIMLKTGDQGVNSTGMNNLRVRIWAKDASGALMLDAWAGVSGNDDPNSAAGGSARQYFTRNVTRADITSRTRMVIGEGIPIPAGAVALVFNIRAESTSAVACPQMHPTNWLLRDGKDASWTDNEVQASTGTGLKTVYVAPAGSDSADGTAASPLKTLTAAIAKIGGTGTVNVAPGMYPGESIPQNLVGDLRIVGLTDSGFNYPVFRFGNPLSGVTKLAGYNRVYSAPLTGYAAGTHPAWMWQDGVPDEDTRETKVSRMSEYMRGMAHRLECTKIWLTTATDKAAALTEMDASNSPLCRWVESEGRVYFTLPNGGDATAAGTAIYAPTGWAALFSGSATVWSASGRVSVTGIKVRYATINTVGFRESVLTDAHSLGCPQNGMDIGCWTKMYSCRFQGVGSSNIAGTFDGVNAHNFSVLEHHNCLFTDNVDDGISCHENCYEIGWSPVMVANLGGGGTPAYGCQAVYYFPYTSRNALQIRKVNGKRGGIESHMSPLTSDPGVTTSVTVYYGISDGDYNGYWSGDTADPSIKATMKCIGCVSIDPVNYGFAVTHMMDCRHTGSGTPRKPGTNAPVNTSIVN